MTKDEILLAQKEHLFPSVFHYYQIATRDREGQRSICLGC